MSSRVQCDDFNCNLFTYEIMLEFEFEKDVILNNRLIGNDGTRLIGLLTMVFNFSDRYKKTLQ